MGMHQSFAQTYHLKGKALDEQGKPIANATGFLAQQKDSTVINYTSTSDSGSFELQIAKTTDSTFFELTAEGFLPFIQKYTEIKGNISLNEIRLKKDTVTAIEGVMITAAPPIRVKEDTIEFNASSFKVKLDGKAEDLLKALPGFEITNDGKIMSNGKEVKEIVVNGKPFFDKDGKIALKNLPADLIKSVQVTTFKTEQEKIQKEKAQSEDLSINFTIDEKKNTGYMAKIYAGYGSDDRYEGSALVSYFKGQRKISILGSANNINVSGFKDDETFNTLGLGRSTGGNTRGITKSWMTGVNYSDQLAPGFDLDNLSYSYTNSDHEARSKVDRTTLLTDYSLRTKSESASTNESANHSVANTFRFKIDDKSNLYFSNNISGSRSDGDSSSESSTFRDDNLLNESKSHNAGTSVNTSLSSSLYYSRELSKKGRRVTLSLNGSGNGSNNNSLTLSETTFAEQPDRNDFRNQRYLGKNLGSNFSNSISYTEPISDSAKVSLSMGYSTSYGRNQREVRDFDEDTEEYDRFNMALSNSLTERNRSFSPSLSYRLNKKELDIWWNASLNVRKMMVNALYSGTDYDFDKKFNLPSTSFSMRFRRKSGMLSFRASTGLSTPSAVQLTPYEDTSNPLSIVTGNPDLKNPWNTNMSVFYRNFNRLKDRSFGFNVSFNYQDNGILSNRFVNRDTGVTQLSYVNVNGNKSVSTFANYSKTFKWNKNRFTVAPRVNFSHNYQNGFVDGNPFTSTAENVSPSLQLTYEIKDRFTFKPSYSLNYQVSHYKNYVIDRQKSSRSVFNAQSLNYFGPEKNLIFENDFSYTTNSNIAKGFKRDFYFWNTSVGYTFFKKQMTAKIMVYDVLNQNQSITHTITDTYFEDREDLILKRYIMFTLSFKLNKFGGKSDAGRGNRGGNWGGGRSMTPARPMSY